MMTAFVDSESYSPNSRVVKVEYMLREGNYCGGIKIGKKHGKMDFDSEDFTDKINVRYKISIPATDYDLEKDLGLFDPSKYSLLLHGGYSFHKFSLNVENIPKYRASVTVTATFEGDPEVLDNAKFGVHFSEWGCK